MSSKQIDNPSGAFGVTSPDEKLGQTTAEFVAAGAIAAKAPVVAAATVGYVAQCATDSAGVIGVALNAIDTGDTGQIILMGGAASVPAGGATTLGTPVIRSAATSGYVTSSATPAVGTKVGIALGASSGGVSTVWVLPW